MAGSTEDNIGYLLLHKNGLIERTKSLTPEHEILLKKGLTVIDLDSLAVFNPKVGWEEIPSLDEEEEEEIEVEEEEEEENFEYDPFKIYSGAKRVLNPYIIWSFCTGKLR